MRQKEQDRHEHMPPLLIGVVEAAHITGLSPRTVWRYASCGKFPPPVRVGGRRLWNRQKLFAWIDADCPKVKPTPLREGGRHV